MSKRFSFVFLSLLAVTSFVSTIQISAWWLEGHQLMTMEAIEVISQALPEWGEFFHHYAYFINDTVTWPDMVFKPEDPKESPRHYYDLEIPPEQRKYEDGVLPYAVENYTLKMIDALKGGDWYEFLVNAGRVAHYIEDAHQPYHCTVNYDPLGKHMIADALIEKHWNELTIEVSPDLQVIENLTDFAMRIIIDSNSKVARLNATLIGDPTNPNDDREWSDDLRDLMSEQASRAIKAAADLWYTAIMKANVSPPSLEGVDVIKVDLIAPEEATTRLTVDITLEDGLGIPVDAKVTWTLGEDTGEASKKPYLTGNYRIIITGEVLSKYAGQEVTLSIRAERPGYTTGEASAKIRIGGAPTTPTPEKEIPWKLVLLILVIVIAILLILWLRRRG
ncbi:MAG: hypothetical protein DRO05_05185 [Thermoproteota archaeon]|nr:MAG: hypothetical protein DRO05_05185 [Candidatus Korarchaeota archaeon]